MNLDLDQIIARLRGVGDLRSVGDAVEFAAIQGAPPLEHQPAAWVIPVMERAGANTRAGQAVLQQSVETFGVVLALGNLQDAVGSASRRQLREVRRAVRQSLLGWVPGEGFDPIELAPEAGRLLGFRDQVVWWQDAYRTSSLVSDCD